MRRSWKEQGQLRSPGFRGGAKGSILEPYVWCVWSSTRSSYWGVGKLEEVSGGYPPPVGTGTYVLLEEQRVYVGKGVHGGLSEPIFWDYDELILASTNFISTEIQWIWQLGDAEFTVVCPLVIMVYPILTPWTIPTGPELHTYEPYTLFHANIAGGSPTGFINPLTGNIDNALGQVSCGQVLMRCLPACGWSTNPPGSQVTKQECVSIATYTTPVGAEKLDVIVPQRLVDSYNSPSNIPTQPNSFATHIRTGRSPSDVGVSNPIYGLGLFAFSLFDYYFWTNDMPITDPRIVLLERGTIPWIAPSITQLRTDVILRRWFAPLNYYEEPPYEDGDPYPSGVPGWYSARYLHRTAAVRETDERALLLGV